jgi:hypothetical protein
MQLSRRTSRAAGSTYMTRREEGLEEIALIEVLLSFKNTVKELMAIGSHLETVCGCASLYGELISC